MKIGFIGLGQMGRPMALRLVEAGHAVTVFNRSRAAAEGFRTCAVVADTAAQALDAEIVISMLADDAAMEAVWIAPGLAATLRAPAIHINMATISLGLAKRLTVLHAQAGSGYVSAPVFGRPPVAALGQLDAIVAGPAEAVARCAPVLAVLARQVFNAGVEPCQANIVKIARNFLLGALIEGLGQAFALTRKSGVDPKAFLDILTSTSLNAPAYRNYGRMMVEEAYEPAQFAMALGMKDMELALQAGGDTQVPMPLAALIREHLLAAIARGHGDKDWVALAQLCAEDAGLAAARAGNPA
ncbi:MAG: NAD(P)-dependent oxidoreductase [Betaproteobacteria bacterium]|nr:NAD(P)-dependent oxidoreductase [Betaproteobacteria bacterium]